MQDPLNLSLTLNPDEAWALAQFVKRADRDTVRQWAGDQREADLIFESWIALRSALAEAGVAPR